MERKITQEEINNIPGLDDRQRAELWFAVTYDQDFGHGTDGHNRLLLLAHLARLLVNQGTKIPTQSFTFDEFTRELDITCYVPKDLNTGSVSVYVLSK